MRTLLNNIDLQFVGKGKLFRQKQREMFHFKREKQTKQKQTYLSCYGMNFVIFCYNMCISNEVSLKSETTLQLRNY